MPPAQRFLVLGLLFIVLAIVEVVAFQFRGIGPGLGTVFFIIGLVFIIRSRRGAR